MYIHLSCPKCGTKNRVPQDKLNRLIACGKCSTELLSSEPFELNDQQFGKFISETELPILVDFWADWCAPCKSFAPVFEQAAKKYPRSRFVKLDKDKSPMISQQYFIKSIPTLILFYTNKEIARVSGALSGADLSRWLQTYSPNKEYL